MKSKRSTVALIELMVKVEELEDRVKQFEGEMKRQENW